MCPLWPPARRQDGAADPLAGEPQTPGPVLEADRTSAAAQLRSFSVAVQYYINPDQPVAADFTYSTWEMAFNEVARLATERLVVVIDEFTYLIETDSSVPSVLQRLWDHRLKRSHVLLI